jgi:hypothetical protein
MTTEPGDMRKSYGPASVSKARLVLAAGVGNVIDPQPGEEDSTMNIPWGRSSEP